METATYLELRDTIRSGDCILWKSKGFVSGVIQLWSEYSHASAIVRFKEHKDLAEHVFLAEALASGVVPRLLSKRIEDEKGRVFLFQPNCLWESSQLRIRHDLMLALTRNIKYDYKGLFGNLLGRVNNDARRYFCSELIWVKWGMAGVLGNGNLTELGEKALKKGKAPRPGDIPLWINGHITEIVKG